ncbi:hypothetical protein OE88DRAFT_1319818 [Heliocybe sulcata]|uniref:Uncharacterized protein n=1 Tax=Heliocybe sulcata TaxID=5364 RepID=A0A5C3N563_9AGAM|nr:hypothetical protein OE88DRAFT_1319818 [Heliocybe sulcata]
MISISITAAVYALSLIAINCTPASTDRALLSGPVALACIIHWNGKLVALPPSDLLLGSIRFLMLARWTHLEIGQRTITWTTSMFVIVL